MSPFINHENIGEVQKTAYLTATVVSVDSEMDTMSFTGITPCPDATDCPIFYHCTNESEQRSNGALEGAAGAFSKDDVVIVQCEVIDSTTYEPLYVIGFADERPRHCTEYLVIQLGSASIPYDKIILWNIVAKSCVSDAYGDDGELITDWPTEADNLDDWFAIHDQVVAQDLLKDTGLWLTQPAHTDVTNDLTLITSHTPVAYSEDYQEDMALPGFAPCSDTISCDVICTETEYTPGADHANWHIENDGAGSASVHRCVAVRSATGNGGALNSRDDIGRVFGSCECNANNLSEADPHSFVTEVTLSESGLYAQDDWGWPDAITDVYHESESSGSIEHNTITPFGDLFTQLFPYSSSWTQHTWQTPEYLFMASYTYSMSMDYLYWGNQQIKSGYTEHSLFACFLYFYGVAQVTRSASGTEEIAEPGMLPNNGIKTFAWGGPIQTFETEETYLKPQFALHAISEADGDPEHKDPFDLSRNTPLETAIGVMVQEFIDEAYSAGIFVDGGVPSVSFTHDFRR